LFEEQTAAPIYGRDHLPELSGTALKNLHFNPFDEFLTCRTLSGGWEVWMATVYRRGSRCRSGFVIFGQGLHLAYSPGAVTSLPFEGLDLSQKLGRECRFAPEALITRIVPQA
jgi:hypothetical protein